MATNRKGSKVHRVRILCWVLCVSSCNGSVAIAQTEKDSLRRAAWETPIVERESSILLQEDGDGPVLARLAYPAKRVLKITSATGLVEFTVGQEASLSEDGCTLRFADCKGISVVKTNALFLPAGAPHSYAHRKDHPEQHLLYAPGHWFHDRNVEITYERLKSGEPNEVLPSVALGKLPLTLQRLRDQSRLEIGVSGDSISTGLDSSGTTQTPPNQPGYVELLRVALREDFNAEVSVENRSVPGWSIANGISDWPQLRESKPELVLIAYGMNDVGRRDPDWFEARLRELIAMIQIDLPGTEILLVSPMLGNAEWVHTPREMFLEYRDRMRKFVGKGIAVADVTEVWHRLLQRKHDLDLTGNGLNHPNDFGHRLYAQAILQLLPAKE